MIKNGWIILFQCWCYTPPVFDTLEPIWSFDYLDKYVFSHYDKVFLMSGTILDKSLFCQLNGLDVDNLPIR